jgi:hypothetical protein
MNKTILTMYEQGIRIPCFRSLRFHSLSATEKIVFSVIFTHCIKSPSGKVRRTISDLISDSNLDITSVTMSKALNHLNKCNLIFIETSDRFSRTLTYSINEQRLIDDEIFENSGYVTKPLKNDFFFDVSFPKETDQFTNINPYEMPVDYFIPKETVEDNYNLVSIPARPLPVPAVQTPVPEEEKPKQKRFVKPTLQEITEVMAVKIREKYGSNVQDALINDQAENFLNYYESNGWRVGKNPMKNWHCAVANWIKNIKTYSTAGTGTSGALIVATAEQSTRPDFDTIYKEVIDIAGKLQNRSNWLSEPANKNIMAGVRTFIAEEIKAHWNLYGESDWKNALNVFIFAQKSPLRYLDPNFCKNNGFDQGLYNQFWTGMSSMAPRESDKLTPVEEYIQSEGFQKQVIEQAQQAKARNEYREKLKRLQDKIRGTR